MHLTLPPKVGLCSPAAAVQVQSCARGALDKILLAELASANQINL